MESALTSFLATIDTPEFRQNNMAKVQAKAAAATMPVKWHTLAVVTYDARATAAPIVTRGLKLALTGK